MNVEVEIKVFVKNPEQVEEKLRQVGKFIKEKTQKDEYFTPQHEDFFAVDPPVKYLRVRYEDGDTNVSYHFLHFDEDGTLLKTDEYITKIKDPDMMMTILKKLDMVHKVTVTKNRKYFDYKEFEVLLDYIEELGYFIEVEVKNTDGDIKELKKKCYQVLDELGADWYETPNLGYPIMILKKQKGD